MISKDIGIKHARFATISKWALGLVGAVIISPVIFLAIKGVVGLAIAGMVGLVIVNFSPWVGMKLANMKYKLIKHESRTNPVDTLENVYLEKQSQRAEFKSQITAFRAKVAAFSDKVEGFKIMYPNDAVKFETQLNCMRALLNGQYSKFPTTVLLYCST